MELIKEVNMCILSILHVFNIYFQSTYQHIHGKDCLEYQFPAWSILRSRYTHIIFTIIRFIWEL